MRKAQFTKTLTVALSPELYRKIREITDAKQISISEWFRDIAKTYLDGNEPRFNSKKENNQS
jgi:metal-responsive CopG/Arc/MetJ family transcriptional regulator